MKISRRHLLALSAGTAAVGAMGSAGLTLHWWNQAAHEPYTSLSKPEGEFIRAWSGVAYPSTITVPIDGASANLDRFFDQLLGVTPSDTKALLKFLLHGLDALSVPTHGATFRTLERDSQRELFDTWIHSDSSMLRSAVQSLTILIGMGWSTHPEVAPTIQKLHKCGYGR